MNDEILVLLAGITVLLIGYAVAQFRKVRREKVEAVIKQFAPADLEAVAVWCGMKAYDATEQLCAAYEAMTPEQKAKWAQKGLVALFKMITTGKASKTAAKVLLEAMIYGEKQSKLAK